MIRPSKARELRHRIRRELERKGIDMEQLCCDPGEEIKVKMVCITPDLKTTLTEMACVPRDRVIMVRLDADTAERLDDWVATGVVRSRSEAAALFIREGLEVRAEELEKLEGALREVEAARDRLQEKAREILGSDKS